IPESAVSPPIIPLMPFPGMVKPAVWFYMASLQQGHYTQDASLIRTLAARKSQHDAAPVQLQLKAAEWGTQ
ncbi:MAG: hypothetical protein WBV33_21865, partial [Terracidiphilus sp.]